jgi:hypothetical protein
MLSKQALGWASGIAQGVSLAGPSLAPLAKAGSLAARGLLTGGKALAPKLFQTLSGMGSGAGQGSPSMTSGPLRPVESWRVSVMPFENDRALRGGGSAGSLGAGSSGPNGGTPPSLGPGSGPRLLGPGPSQPPKKD